MKTIITAAVTGSLTTRDHNPNIPYTPEEIARAAIESWQAGAAVVHLHVRDPQSGRPVQKAELFKEVIRRIRTECDVIINTSTGGGPDMTFEERIAILPELAAEPDLKPEMASLNCGSVNFGMLDKKQRGWKLTTVQANPWDVMLRFADTMKRLDIKPELEIYEAGMINNAKVLHSLDALKAPLHFQFVLGVLGALQTTLENLVFLKNSIPQDATWSVCAAGPDIFAIGTAAVGAGGHVRVGFEDCVHIARGVPADSNAQMVAKMVRIAKEIGREVATPREARSMLGL